MQTNVDKDRVNEIDLLRFIAALAVLFFHYSFRGFAADHKSVLSYPLLLPAAKYGYLGVELFFMISGFVILMTAASGSLRKFTISRIVRLYPGFWACCSVTFLAILTIGGERYSASISEYLVNMTMLSGFVDTPPIDGAYWSLFVEMRFYFLVAIILALRMIEHAQTLLIAWLVCTIALLFIPIGKLSVLLITDYSAYFIAGAMYFIIWKRGITLARLGTVLVAWLLAVHNELGTLEDFSRQYNSRLSATAVVTVISVCFLSMFLVSIQKTGWISRKRWMLAGSLTYPLYLLHQNIGFMVFNALFDKMNIHLLFWGTVILIIGMALAVNEGVEKCLSVRLKSGLNTIFDRICRLTAQAS